MTRVRFGRFLKCKLYRQPPLRIPSAVSDEMRLPETRNWKNKGWKKLNARGFYKGVQCFRCISDIFRRVMVYPATSSTVIIVIDTNVTFIIILPGTPGSGLAHLRLTGSRIVPAKVDLCPNAVPLAAAPFFSRRERGHLTIQ
jgi:hypothetical protein